MRTMHESNGRATHPNAAFTSLRDGFVDIPTTRLRRPGNKVFGKDLPSEIPLVEGVLRLSVIWICPASVGFLEWKEASGFVRFDRGNIGRANC